ncbi:MAG: DUF5615 family PIN-like protein [Tepidiformaceae bacterium]
MTEPRFFTDENIEVAIAVGAVLRGLDAQSARDLRRLTLPDGDHLKFCLDHGLVLVTHDAGIRRRHWSGEHHTGIVFVPSRTPIGVVIDWLELIAAACTAEEMVDRLESVKQ